ncbi:MAG: RagB/SusD family nutrient uptake outer membrane protein [Bacteroidaceae bacterium]|nr:RagB/SusD family nutrient uptake outer membrane protein [Bacteroidaceae bacterium]MBO4841151.1 RagB/SusD family nutrient uptake outer membrane protein [Bacteroidaceae bacterium]
MKKITIYNTAITLALGLSVSAFTACESLDQGNLSELAESNLPQSDEDAKALVNAVYASDIELATTFMYLIDLPTETTVSGENPNGGGGMLGLLSWDGSNSYITKLWQAIYTSTARANDVIAKLEARPDGVSEKIARQVVGEAKFLRAYYLNYAVQLWGPVPIVTTVGGGVNAVRSSETEVYQQIVNDLTDAADKLPEVSEYGQGDIGRATRGAANAALAKVYLTWAQVDDNLNDEQRREYFDKAAQYAQKVIDSNQYALEEEFYDNWNNQNRNGKESIFAIQFYLGSSTRNNDASGNNHLCHCSFSTSYSVALPHIAPGPDNTVENSYLPGDQRKDVSFADSLWRPSTQSYFHFYYDADGDGIKESGYSRYNKYIDHDTPETSAADRAMNRQVIRLAEVYLVLAEAINERDRQPNNLAYEAFNKVRRRAFREDINGAAQPHDLTTGLDYEGFRNAIIQERSWEFTLEQKHLLDLKRWKILVKTIKNSKLATDYPEYKKQTIDFKHYRYPIPQAQREVNPNLWQNYGYDGSEIASNPYKGRE